MNVEYALIGPLAAVPIAVIIVVLALRGYDATLTLQRKNKEK